MVFSHSKHLAKKGQRGTPAFSCAGCHTGNKSKKHYTMDDMYKGQSCGACHNGERSFGVDDCTLCHR